MAKKKLNKKVAIIGTIILAILVMGVILFLLTHSKDPYDLIKDAEFALANKDYKAAAKAYGEAMGHSKTAELRVEILFKLADMYQEMNEWQKVAGCWNKIITIDTENITARKSLLDYTYQLASTGSWGLWKTIESNASELIEQNLDESAFVYLARGRSNLEMVMLGHSTYPDESIKNCMADIEKAIEIEPNNVNAYQFLAQAVIKKGEMEAAKGNFDAKKAASDKAVEILKEAVNSCSNNPQAYINYLNYQQSLAGGDKEKLAGFESEYLSLARQFSEHSMVFAALSDYYQLKFMDIDKAIDAIEKARALEPENVSYAISSANLYYRRYSVESELADLEKATEIAEQALTYPESQERAGPGERQRFVNRYTLNIFLANCYIEQAQLQEGASAKEPFLEQAGERIHTIEQLLGSGINPYVMMWKGKLALAKGETDAATEQLYAAYEQLTASKQDSTDASFRADMQLAQLSYDLAKIFENTTEVGAALNFYGTAISNRIFVNKPDSLLEYANMHLKIRNYTEVLNAVDIYEQIYISTPQTNLIRVQAYGATAQFEEAEKTLDELDQNAADVIKSRLLLLQARINRLAAVSAVQGTQDAAGVEAAAEEIGLLRKQQVQYIDKLFSVSAEEVPGQWVVNLAEFYVEQDETAAASSLVDKYLQSNPNDAAVLVYRRKLSEPNPAEISPERADEITEAVFAGISDPFESAVLLGRFYSAKNELDKAVGYYQKALKIKPDDEVVVAALFELATATEDFELAEQLADVAEKNNIDKCGGLVFRARLDVLQEKYKPAIEKLDAGLLQRPVFSYAYFLRSQANSGLGKDDDALSDIQKAFSLSRLDGRIAKQRAYLLYNRNQKLGANVTADQIAETRAALIYARSTNPRDLALQSFYAEYISTSSPQEAIAIRQEIQRISPSAENSLLLANMAFRIADRQQITAQKDAYLEIAEDAYKNALQFEPTNERVLNYYSEFLRNIDRADEAENLLKSSEDVLWKYYVRDGKFEAAKEILQELYAANPKETEYVRGLLLVARKTADKDGVVKYSKELLKLDDSVDSQIIQIETYLEIGLIQEAEKLLGSFREKQPDEPRSLFLDAWLTSRQGKLADGLKLTNQLLEIDDSNPRNWRLRGQINSGLGNYNDAIEDFQRSKNIQDSADIRIDLAKTYVKAQKIPDAITELKLAIDRQESPIAARTMLEEIYLLSGQNDKLRSFYLENIEKYPQASYWYNQMAALEIREKNYTQAVRFYKEGWEQSQAFGGNANSLDGYLGALLLNKDYETLFEVSSKYIDSNFAPIAYSRMGQGQFESGDKAAALDFFQKSLEKSGSNDQLMVEMLKRMSAQLGASQAINWCIERLKETPNSLAVNASLLNLYKMNQDYNKALEQIEVCKKIAGAESPAYNAYVFEEGNILNMAYAKTNDKDYLVKSIAHYKKMLRETPDNVQVLNNLAYLLADNSEQLDYALSCAQKAYNALPNNPNILDTYAYTLLKNGEYQKADEFLQMAVQLFEQNSVSAPAEVYIHIGQVKEGLGQKEEALTAYKNALNLGKEQLSEKMLKSIELSVKSLSK